MDTVLGFRGQPPNGAPWDVRTIQVGVGCGSSYASDPPQSRAASTLPVSTTASAKNDMARTRARSASSRSIRWPRGCQSGARSTPSARSNACGASSQHPSGTCQTRNAPEQSQPTLGHRCVYGDATKTVPSASPSPLARREQRCGPVGVDRRSNGKRAPAAMPPQCLQPASGSARSGGTPPPRVDWLVERHGHCAARRGRSERRCAGGVTRTSA
jgi:hypothetical protein